MRNKVFCRNKAIWNTNFKRKSEWNKKRQLEHGRNGRERVEFKEKEKKKN